MKKILIIEDELAYLNLLEAELSKNGYKVIKAMDGKKGLKLAKKEKPDLILLDLRLPVMDGMTLLGLLRQDKSSKQIKVVILTNLEPTEKIIANAVEDQLAYYFVKSDTNFDTLLKKIEQLLSK